MILTLQLLKLYEKAGLKREGFLRDTVQFDGEYWNSIIMSMLEHEVTI
jgi:RimJ/RimL family protein N-acetyltransferase